ncbi:uncharacterized protein LOC128958479 [Oppia nitens]|uniref:uncharacterized protein LOC128958479 n=1 Tax=Oppia nitens TaxID=1686743 RepID=UPI0023DBF448|nr:uncharacterized protein LOC128958479 [Oppia nitens]
MSSVAVVDQIDHNINELPFKLRFTSTQKLCKEIQKMINDRYDMYDKLVDEYEHIGQHKQILAHIKIDLETCHESLKQLRSLCQCQSDDDKTALNKQLTASEEQISKLLFKCNTIQTVKMVDIDVKRLPSNWRAAMLKIARDKAKKAFNESMAAISENTDGSETTDEIKDNINDNKVIEMDENMISSEAEEINHQFEIDLERKIYETQVDELMQMIQGLVIKIKTQRARIDISKQLIKVVLKLKREYETANSKLKESLATCHCAEAGADDDQEFQKRIEEKKQLEEKVENASNDLKYWEEQYVLLKESKTKSNEKPEIKEEKNANTNNQMTTTIVVANEEQVSGHTYASTSGQSSCMYASGQSTTNTTSIPQGTANPAVIYFENLVAHQQPTYIPNTSAMHTPHPITVYPHTYTISQNQHQAYTHQAPDGSIQVYSTDISSHPGYIAYQ